MRSIPGQVLAEFVAELCDADAIDALLGKLANSEARDRLGETAAELARVSSELEQVRAEKTALEEELKMLRLPDVEQLLVYLPAIYRNFWTVVRPDEVAMLAGTFKPITVPSPFPDPTPDTVLVMKQRLKAMVPAERQKILEFCRGLRHQLHIRPEMRDLFES
jgi:hypothetical protein